MSQVVHEFTATVPRWSPYVTPVELDKATPEQRDAMQITPSSKGISPYVLTLAHDPESLKVRSPLFSTMRSGRGGLSSGGRERGAVAASIVNSCVYCVAVHASRFNQLTKRPEVMETIFAGGVEAELEDHHQAIFDFAVKLSQSPPAAGPAEIAALRDIGLSEIEILDLMLSASIFGWANRLMHTLGEPVRD